MAYAFRLRGPEVFIRVTSLVLNHSHDVALRVGEKLFLLPVSRCEGSIIELQNLMFTFEQVIVEVGELLPYLIIKNRHDSSVLITEELQFHPSFFKPFFDFARNPEILPFARAPYQPPECLAIFTHVHNEQEGLAIWEKHYASLVPHRHLFVIDHGSDRSPSDILHNDTQVVTIPRGVVDHINIGQFCAHFQRFLLDQFRWVIHVDCDELLIDRRGSDALLAKLLTSDYGPIVRPLQAVELLDHTDGHIGIDINKPLSFQRQLIKDAKSYRKPVLARVPTTWGLGFHHAFEDAQTSVDPDLWLIHIRYADLALAARREGIWTDAEQSESAKVFTPQHTRCQTLESLRERVTREFSDGQSTMPEWMVGAF